MKKAIAAVALLLTFAGCASYEARREKKIARETYQDTFYMKFLDPGSPLDQEITARVVALRVTPRSPQLHNELGAFLFQRRFLGDAEKEFRKAVGIDKKFYQGWYNLALVQLAQDRPRDAECSLERTISIMSGHSEALFRLGLIYEESGRDEAAIEKYSKAFRINHDLFDPRKNPLIVDSKLTSSAILAAYDREHASRTARFLGPPAGYQPPPDKEELKKQQQEEMAKKTAALLAPPPPPAPPPAPQQPPVAPPKQ